MEEGHSSRKRQGWLGHGVHSGPCGKCYRDKRGRGRRGGCQGGHLWGGGRPERCEEIRQVVKRVAANGLRTVDEAMQLAFTPPPPPPNPPPPPLRFQPSPGADWQSWDQSCQWHFSITQGRLDILAE